MMSGARSDSRARDPLMAVTRMRTAFSPSRGWTAVISMPPKRRPQAAMISPIDCGLAMSDNTTQIACRVWLTYDHFAPGQRYRLEVRPQLRKALALLTDANGQLVAKTDFQGRMDCGLF